MWRIEDKSECGPQSLGSRGAQGRRATLGKGLTSSVNFLDHDQAWSASTTPSVVAGTLQNNLTPESCEQALLGAPNRKQAFHLGHGLPELPFSDHTPIYLVSDGLPISACGRFLVKWTKVCSGSRLPSYPAVRGRRRPHGGAPRPHLPARLGPLPTLLILPSSGYHPSSLHPTNCTNEENGTGWCFIVFTCLKVPIKTFLKTEKRLRRPSKDHSCSQSSCPFPTL